LGISIRVTERDLEVLMGCYANVFLSFKQIKKRYFKEQERTTAYSRLSLLMRSGYLQSVSVGGILDEKSTVSVVYQVTRLAYELLLKKCPEETEDEVFLNKINLSCVWHDHLLSDVIWQLKSRKSDMKVLNTKVFQITRWRHGKKPDAVLLDLKSQKKCAVELELTRKSDRRYRDIVSNYRIGNEFESVIYVTKTEALSEKIKEVIRGKTPKGFTPKDTGRFYFVAVGDLLANDECTISNGKNKILGRKRNIKLQHEGAAS